MLGSRLASSPKMTNILQQRQFVYAWTSSWAIPSFMGIPRLREGTKQIRGPINDALSYHRNKYQYRGSAPTVRMAAVYGRHGVDRLLNVRTFSGYTYIVPVASTRACNYLLMADTVWARYAVVLSPIGVSLITRNASITIGYDNQLYSNKCKQPLDKHANMQYDGFAAVRHDDRISVMTHYGLEITCYTLASDVCVFSLTGSHVNDTIGLLGTNTGNEPMDMRKPDGSYTTDVPEFLASYVVSGPEMCRSPQSPAPERNMCNQELHNFCFEMFNSLQQQTQGCSNFIKTFPFMDACRRETQRCDSMDQDVCHSYIANLAICQSFVVTDPKPSPPVPCNDQPEMDNSVTGSLDVVYVMSEHNTMSGARQWESWQYVWELVAEQRPELYSDVNVRVGLVGFAGPEHSPRRVLLGDNRDKLFEDRSTMDYESVKTLSTAGMVDSDAFDAIQAAADYPFNPTSHKMIVVMMTKKQGTGVAVDLSMLEETLEKRGIILNVFSTYNKPDKLASRRALGIDWQGNVITVRRGTGETEQLMLNDYTKLVKATKGAVFDLKTIPRGRNAQISRILEHFSEQIKASNTDTCLAA